MKAAQEARTANGVQILLDYSRKWGLGSQEGRQPRAQVAVKGMLSWAWNESKGKALRGRTLL